MCFPKSLYAETGSWALHAKGRKNCDGWWYRRLGTCLDEFHTDFCSQVQITFADHSTMLCNIPDTGSHRGALPVLFLVRFSGGKIQAAGSCPVITLLAVLFLLCIYMLCQPKFTYYCFHADLIITSTTHAKFYCKPFSWSGFSPISSSSYLPD